MRLSAALVCGACVVLSACSSPQPKTENKGTPPGQWSQVAATNKNPAAKYIELAGFRVNEKGPGNLRIQLAVINHSEADLGDLTLRVNLHTSTGKPDDPPLVSFPVQVKGLGAEQLVSAEATVPTKLRAYELPDWQFLRAEFEITEPK